MSDWKVEKVSTPEKVFGKIKKLQERGVISVVIVGADTHHKAMIYDSFASRIARADRDGELRYPSTVYLNMMDKLKSRKNNIAKVFAAENDLIVEVTGRLSGDHEARHRIVEALYQAGATGVVMVYAKHSDHPDLSAYTPEQAKIIGEQIVALVTNPPTSDGIDYLVTVTEKNF